MDYSVVVYLAVINTITFIVMGVDKRKAIHGEYRISERTIWILSILGGATGCYIGMKTYRHKTRHLSFVIGVPFVISIQLIALAYLSFSLS
ncbi:DUF1294 domain-containing protein [Virgibacillus xinjiangensis]|uniref:DUF1294 domain-containing protein n=1 Tax=Virgibacillus xinjiangensis TaxID=393090 RepID=A0ABV7CUC0_9BACI